MATIHVDGIAYRVDGDDNLLAACLSLGLDLPYFCWHPALGSVGACRQCAVKQYRDADDEHGSLVMACMPPAADGTRLSIDDAEARAFRRGVIEWLMLNHPHDCPVCEEGGHCHLQDMTVMTGHARRRYRFTKRTHRNQDLGPFLGHEMNRCITCYRCVRFYRDHAGGEDLGAFGAGDNIYFGRHRDGPLESPFAGNLSEVCPTGVFTDRPPDDHYTRKWDLQFAPSVCHQCAVGCNISPGERYGELRRVENRYHGEINRFFLCDRGRYGYGYVNRDDRPRLPEWRESPEATAVTLEVDAALDRAGDRLRSARRVIGIGSPRASLESNHRLRELVGAEHFSLGVTAAEAACLATMARLHRECGLPTPSLREIEAHDAVLVLGEDPWRVPPGWGSRCARRRSAVARRWPRRAASRPGTPRRSRPWPRTGATRCSSPTRPRPASTPSRPATGPWPRTTSPAWAPPWPMPWTPRRRRWRTSTRSWRPPPGASTRPCSPPSGPGWAAAMRWARRRSSRRPATSPGPWPGGPGRAGSA